MSIKSQGGVFGRNPTFNDVTVEGDFSVDGTLSVGGNVLSGLDFEGAWDATSGAPSATPSTGQFWIVSVAGTTNLSGITNWGIGDWALYDGSAWQRIEGGADGNFNQLTSSGTTILNGTTIPASKTLVVTTDIGSTVEAYDATILKSADIGSTVQGYDADTAKYDDTTANFTGTLQNGGSNVVVDSDIGSTVQAYDATILKSADIGSTVQAYDADTAKLDVAQTFTADQTFSGNTKAATYSVGVDAANLAGKYAVSTAFSSGGSPTGLTYATTGTAVDQGILNAYYLSSGSQYNRCLDIACIGNPDGTYAGSIIRFLTNPITNNAPAVEALKIDENQNVKVSIGNLVIGTSGNGIDFSATAGTGTSELLDDYEEGTWTPTIGGVSVGSGIYTKVGRLVFIECLIEANSVSTDTIDGLPFNLTSAAGYGGITFGRMGQCDVLDANGVPCRPVCSGTTIQFRANAVNTNDSTFTITTPASGTVRLGINGVARAY
jgi:hypothetical protein